MKGKITKLEELQRNPENIRKDVFLKIHGVGPSNVEKLMRFKSIEDLRAASEADPNLLSHG